MWSSTDNINLYQRKLSINSFNAVIIRCGNNLLAQIQLFFSLREKNDQAKSTDT